MKKAKGLLAIAISLLVLSACGKLNNSGVGSSNTQSGGDSSSSSGYQTTGQTSDDFYQGIIKSGKYLVSQSRGVSVSQNSNGYNLKSFESGLLSLSKAQFSTQDYMLQEGQILSKETTQNWLARKSATNPDGLNPEDNGKTEPTERNPMYVQNILEQDYMKSENDNLTLSGITIGIAMNRYDYYQKIQYGATFQTEISTAEMEKQGKAIADQVLARLRAKKEVGNVPIVIALYEQAPNDSLVGGTFFASGVAKDGAKTMANWTSISEANVVLPVVGTAKAVNENDANDFENFRSQIESFFPNLSGTTAQAHYENNTLQGLNITITTQFYGLSEIESFTNYTAQMAQKYLPQGVKTDITVTSTEGIQAFLSRSASSKTFTSHVFGSY